MSIFTSKKSLELFGKNSADKVCSKKDRGWKVPCLMPIRVKACFRGRRCAATQPLAYFLLFSSRSVCLIGMEAVVRNDQVIGFIRRADYGFFIDMPIAYGYVLILLRTYYFLCFSDEILWWKIFLGAWSIFFLLKNKYSLFCF